MKKIPLLISLIVCVVIFLLYIGRFFTNLEFRAYDTKFKLRGPIKPYQNIVIVTVDEDSIKKLGRFQNWKRSMHAKLVRELTKAGAKVIAFDILFTEYDEDNPETDLDFASALKESGKVILATYFSVDRGEITDFLIPIPEFVRNSKIGHVVIFPEIDGVARKIMIGVKYFNREIPHLSIGCFAMYNNKTPEDVLKELKIPVDENNEMWINFVGGYETFPYYSYWKVITGLIDMNVFKDKIVIVGGTAAGLFDFKAIPFAHIFAGVEIHANAISNYFQRNYIKSIGFPFVPVSLLVIAILSGLILQKTKPLSGTLFSLPFLGLYLLCSFLLFKFFNIQTEVVPQTFAILGCYIGVYSYRLFVEEKEKRWIKNTFSSYLSPKVVDMLQKDPTKLQLGGEEKEITIFFSDIADFTSIAESLKSDELTKILNAYLNEMTDVILKYDGVVDKFIGDAIMAFWNAPLEQPEHPKLACFAAIDNIKKLKELNKRFELENLPKLGCRIGLNTGPMKIGNFGSKSRFEFTVIGDAVNLGARLEGVNKIFKTRIIISEFTYQKVKDEVITRELDLIRVKGKKLPVRIYELIDRKDQTDGKLNELIQTFHYGLDMYRKGNFSDAIKIFENILKLNEEDYPSRVYISRCEYFEKNLPPPDWDGIFTLTEK